MVWWLNLLGHDTGTFLWGCPLTGDMKGTSLRGDSGATAMALGTLEGYGIGLMLWGCDPSRGMSLPWACVPSRVHGTRDTARGLRPLMEAVTAVGLRPLMGEDMGSQPGAYVPSWRMSLLWVSDLSWGMSWGHCCGIVSLQGHMAQGTLPRGCVPSRRLSLLWGCCVPSQGG